MFEFNGFTINLVTLTYHDGCTAIRAVEADGAPFATLSVHMDRCLPHGEFFLKDWSENADLAAFLVEEGFIKRAKGAIAISGHIFAEPFTLA